MNILYINHYAGSPDMGMEFRPYYFAREWVRMGHIVTIVAGDYSHLRQKNPQVTNDFTERTIDGVTYSWVRSGHYEGNGAARAFSMFRFVGKLLANARHIEQRYHPDVVIASSTYPLDTYAVQRIARISRAKYIHEVHDMWPSTLYEVGGMSKSHPFVRLLQIAEDSAYKHCTKCVSLLPYAKEYMIEHGLRADKFVHIPNGIIMDEWKNPEPLPVSHKNTLDAISDAFIVGYFGGHAISNALDVLLDAAKMERGSDVRFVLVGDGVEKTKLMERAEREEINNVTFLPPVPKLAVPSLVERFSCSFISGADSPLYRFGICSNKMFDSMAAGIPIIYALNAPPTPVEQYDCGLQVSPTVEGVLEAIKILRSMKASEILAMGERGRRAAVEHFSYETLASEFLASIG